MDYLERARQISTAPPAGAPYSVQIAGSEQAGRTPIYRHWRFQKQLLDTLDPHVNILYLHHALRNMQSDNSFL